MCVYFTVYISCSGIIGIVYFDLYTIRAKSSQPIHTLSTPHASLRSPDTLPIITTEPTSLYPLNHRRTFPVPNGAPVDLINISIKLSEIGFFAITPEPCACIYILYIYLLYANEMQDEMRWSYI